MRPDETESQKSAADVTDVTPPDDTHLPPADYGEGLVAEVPLDDGGAQEGEPWLRVILAALAVGLAVVAFGTILLEEESALVRGLWLASMVILIASQAKRPRLRLEVRLLLPLLLILIVAGVFRFYRLGEIPDQFHGDIASQGAEASAYLNGREFNLFQTGWSDYPNFEFWQMVATMRLFGDNMFGLSMAAALQGLLSILGTYLLARELFDRRVRLLATALLSISYTHIQFSRIVGTIAPLTFAPFVFFFLIRGLRGRGSLSFVLSGIFLGLGLQTYFSARMIPAILVLFIPWLLLWQRDVLRRNVTGLGWMALGFFTAFGPFLAFALQAPEQFMGRGSVVTLLNPTVIEHLMTKYHVDSALAVVWENLKRSLLMFSAYGDASTHFSLGKPMVDLLTASSLMLGVGIAFRRMRQARYFLLLVWLFGTMFLGSIITNDAPFWPHLTILLIPVAILAAVALARLWSVLTGWFGEPGDRLGAVLIFGALAYVGLNNWVLYYEYTQANATPLVRLARIIAETDPSSTVLLIPDPYYLRDREINFMAQGRNVREISPETVRSGDAPAGTSVLYVVTPNYQSELETLLARYPDAQVKQYLGQEGHFYFTTVRVGGSGGVAAAPGRVDSGDTSLPQPQPTYPPIDFDPRYTFTGSTSSSLWEIEVGAVVVSGGQFTLRVGPVSGHDVVYDYVKLVATNGKEFRFEAEDPRYTTGDEAYSPRLGTDGHWWLQKFGLFSGEHGLVAHKTEAVPVLTTTVPVSDGRYRLYVGSFTGDHDNGVFALGIDF